MTFQVSFISLNTGTKYLVMGIAEEVLCQGCANRREAVIHSFLYKHNSFKDFIHPYLTYTHFDFYKQAFHQYHQAEIEQSSVRGEDQSCVPEPHLLTPSASRPRGTRTCCFTNVPPRFLIPPLATQTAKWCLRDNILCWRNTWSRKQQHPNNYYWFCVYCKCCFLPSCYQLWTRSFSTDIWQG